MISRPREGVALLVDAVQRTSSLSVPQNIGLATE